MPFRIASLLSYACFLAACLVLSSHAMAEQTEGDQFLDGIGETALVARYRLAGDVLDSTRHHRDATLHLSEGVEPGEAFVEDERFGQVLLLNGSRSRFVELPGGALSGLDSVSVSGWICLQSTATWQRFFDFGESTTANFFCTPVGRDAEEGLRARITDSGWGNEQGPLSERIEVNQWVHLAVVLDASSRTLTTYVDGQQAGIETKVNLTLESVLNQDESLGNNLFFGKSQHASDVNLKAKLHDVRIYSIALSETQVARIYDGRSASLEEMEVTEGEPEQASNTTEIRRRDEIVAVSDVSVETTTGHLPRLPRMLPATFREGYEATSVRVIWPAPEDNQQVLKAGSYTVIGKVPGTELTPKATVRVVEAVDDEERLADTMLESFTLDQVVLKQDAEGHDTLFMRNRDKFVRGLVESNPDQFLYMFRDAFGEEQPEGAEPLGVWDSQTTRLRGHASGHYLTAIAQAYASTTYDAKARQQLKQKMDYLIETLHALSLKSGRPVVNGGESNADPAAVPVGAGKSAYDSDLSKEGIRTDYWNWGEGFVSAYPPDQFIMLEQDASYGGGNHQVWAPYYTLHKILAGLLDCYEVGGNEKALEVAHQMGLWVHARLNKLPTATRISMWNRYIAGEYGGMNEVLARLYRLTDDKRMIECAQLFDNIDFFFGNAEREHGLARNVDTIRGKHANQHIPQIIGALETYRSTRDQQYYRVADNFWHHCTGSYQYAIGGVAGASMPNNAECFTAEPDSLFKNGFSEAGQNETCATYNLLKLSRQLFRHNPNAKYIDYYERALYNHILASVAENSSANTYHVPLNPGSRKHFGNATMDGFTCCNGTALESSTKLQNTIYFKSSDNQTLYVNLFVPSTLDWTDRNVVVRQETSFPYSDTTKLTIEGEGKFAVRLRIPSWATSGVRLAVNGESVAVEASAGEYLTIERSWQSGDVIELQMPFSFRLSQIMDRPNIASIFYGPVLLAVEEPRRLATWRQVELNTQELSQSITGNPQQLRFQIGDLKLKPFFETYGRYSVYLDIKPEQ